MEGQYYTQQFPQQCNPSPRETLIKGYSDGLVNLKLQRACATQRVRAERLYRLCTLSADDIGPHGCTVFRLGTRQGRSGAQCLSSMQLDTQVQIQTDHQELAPLHGVGQIRPTCRHTWKIVAEVRFFASYLP